jgi:NAD(P)H-dependent FMN reductase/ribosomal protein S18 acetylase RimI-like enzyme
VIVHTSTTRPILGIVIGSTRPGRVGPAVADWFAGEAEIHRTFDVRVFDLASVALPLLDEPEHPSSGIYAHDHTKRWSEMVAGADAFVFVTTEYNRGVPAPLKNALGYLYTEWSDKPAAIVSYGMTSMGLRAAESLRLTISALGMVLIPDLVAIPLRQRLDADGHIDPDTSMTSAARAMLDALARLIPASMLLRDITEPTDSSDVIISRAARLDAGEITTLQRAAFLTDAQLYGDAFLPSLTQSCDEIADVIDDPSGVVLVARVGHRLVGSVRASVDGNTAHISRLMTAPDVQGLGIGRQLMSSIEAALDSEQFELSTGSLSTSNLAFYDRLGYRPIGTETLGNGLDIVTMAKSGQTVREVA